MYLRIRAVPELVEHDRTRDFLNDLVGSREGIGHEYARGKHVFRTQVPQQRDPLSRHRLRHRQNQPVASNGRDVRESNPGIAASRFHQGRSSPQNTFLLSIFDKRNANSVFDASAGVSHF